MSGADNKSGLVFDTPVIKSQRRTTTTTPTASSEGVSTGGGVVIIEQGGEGVEESESALKISIVQKKHEDIIRKKIRRGIKNNTIRVTTLANVVKDEEESRLNEYLVLKNIGAGANGQVKLVSLENELFACKVYNKALLGKQSMKARRSSRGVKPMDPLENVRKEIAVMKKMDHPNIVKLYEVIDDPTADKIYMIIEFVGGGLVMNIDDGEPDTRILPEDKTWGYFRDMIQGLEYIHSQHIVHRDIKPENLLVTTKGVLKIADFGVSEIYGDEDDKMNRTVGTTAFMAPEMTTGDEYLPTPIDIWAVGITLYCFVYGTPPFLGENLVGTYDLIQHSEVSFPKPINRDLEDLIRKLLDKEPKTRITVPQIKVHPWVTKNGTAPLQDVKPPIELENQDIKGAVSHLTQTMKNFDNIEKKMNNLASRIKRNIAKQKALRESSVSGLDSTRDEVTSTNSSFYSTSEDDIEEVKVSLDDGEVIVIKKGANPTEGLKGSTSTPVQVPLATVSTEVASQQQQNATPAHQENKQLNIKTNDSGLATKGMESKSSDMGEDAPLKKTSSSYHAGDPVAMKNIKDQVGADESSLVDLITQVQSKRDETSKLKRRKTTIVVIGSILFIVLVVLLAYFLVPR